MGGHRGYDAASCNRATVLSGGSGRAQGNTVPTVPGLWRGSLIRAAWSQATGIANTAPALADGVRTCEVRYVRDYRADRHRKARTRSATSPRERQALAGSEA